MSKINSKNNKKIILLVVILVIIAVLIFLNLQNGKQPNTAHADSEFTVYMLDVVQGDCFYIDNGDNDIIIDSGPDDVSDSIATDLYKLGADNIEYMFVSHSDADHIGGANDIINALDVENFVMSKDERTTKNYKRMISSLKDKNITPIYAYKDDSFEAGDAHIQILSPDKTKKQADEENDRSLVILITFNGVKYLFTGDAGEDVEEQILKNYSPDEIDCDLLKVSHHGSKSATSSEFLKVVTPRIALISAGDDNSYGHPHSKTLARLYEYCEKLFRTDKNGTVAICEKNGTLWEE